MSYDLYASFPCATEEQVNGILSDNRLDVQTRIRLLAPALNSRVKDYARTGDRRGGGYKHLVFADNSAATPFSRHVIGVAQQQMTRLHLWQPTHPDFSLLPRLSAFLQFQFSLTRPYLSRDDAVFHINENPVRKDKVFKVPMVAGSSWKGNLRWTAMKVDLEPVRDNPEEFASRRFRHTLLFGSEKGFETGEDWEQFLDHRCSANADQHACGRDTQDPLCNLVRERYRALLRSQFTASDSELPHLAGWLRFYPTFFDCIGLEVINPHDRETRAGKQPLYFESAPIGSTGTFSLLYAPFGGVAEDQARADLVRIGQAVSAMMLTYGFSAKKTSGFGEAADAISEGHVWTSGGRWPLTHLSSLHAEVAHVEWG